MMVCFRLFCKSDCSQMLLYIVCIFNEQHVGINYFYCCHQLPFWTARSSPTPCPVFRCVVGIGFFLSVASINLHEDDTLSKAFENLITLWSRGCYFDLIFPFKNTRFINFTLLIRGSACYLSTNNPISSP